MKILTNKFLYISAIALFAVMASGLYLLSDSTIVSAQKGDLASRGETKAKVAREDHLNFALRLGTAADYTVFGAKGVKGDGASVEGKRGTGLDEASLGENGSGLKARSDLNKALGKITQLPCQEMEAALTGGSFEPGVYCAPSAALAGQMTLSGDGRYVFIIEGAMKSADNFQMNLENGAKAGNVYFVADTASLGAWNTMSGSVIARGMVDIGAGTKVSGRAVSKEGEVILADGANLAMAPGYIQICKRALHDGVATTGANDFDPYDFGDDLTDNQNSLRYKVFRFQINGGAIIGVPTGQCSGPILVNDATASVTELIDGYYLNRAPSAPDYTWFNRFRLVDVRARVTTGGSAPTLTTDYSTRTTTFDVPTTPSTDPVIVTFTNTFAIPAVIEICKYSASTITTTTGGTPPVAVADTEVTGFFDFHVNTNPGARYTVPVGFCSGPIQVLVPTFPPAPAPARGFVFVTELGEPGFTLETMRAIGGNGEDRQYNSGGVFPAFDPAFDLGLNNVHPCILYWTNWDYPTPGCPQLGNPRGGMQGGLVFEATTAANQTIFQFFNRTNPGIIKICKIAGRGVPIGTEFAFVVRGRQAESQAVGGTRILPGADISRRVVVPAGPAAQGGFCEIVSEESGANTLWIVGTLAYVRETRVMQDVAGVENGGFGDLNPAPDANDGAATDPDSEIRVSRIDVNGSTAASSFPAGTVQGITLGSGGVPNPDLFQYTPNVFAPDAGRQAIFRVNRGETVVTYVNRLFRPTQLKICKVAGTGIAVGTPFTFIVSIDAEGGLVPGQTNEPIGVPHIVIPAGDPAQSAQGNCVVVDGPYERPGQEANSTIGPPLSFGTFDVGSAVSVSEIGLASSVVITSPTGPASALTVDAAIRRATLIMGYPGGFNELIFVNSAATPVSTGFSLAGRVMTPDGGGLRNAQVILTKADGTRMTVPTSSMGYYNFGGLANETYTVSVSSRRYRFSARSIDLSASLANVDFTGIE